MSNLWSDSDVKKLKSFVNEGMSKKFIADYFNRTETAIEIKVSRLGMQLLRPNRNWKDSDLHSFKEDWQDPTVSISMMTKKYNRSLYSLRKKALELSLGARPYNDEFVTISDICREMNVSHDRVSNWIKLGLKTRKSKSGKSKYLISQDDLLKFLETHQSYFNASCVSEYLFCDEPEWFKDKRLKDIKEYAKNSRQEYTNEEDKKIIRLFKRGRSDKEIAEELKRTEQGIKLRLNILGYYRGKYNDYEIEILKANSRYMTIPELLKLLPLRTEKGIIYKCESLGLPYHLSKERCESRVG